MVQILPNTKGPSFWQSIAGGLQEGMKSEAERKMKQDAIKLSLGSENEALKKQYGIDLSGVIDPAIRHQIMADELIFGKKRRQSEVSKDIDYSLKQGGRTPEKRQRFLEENKLSERKESPEFVGKKRMGASERQEKGNFPQPETEGLKRRVFTPEDVLEKGKQIAQQSTQAGQPMTVLEGYDIANSMNEANKNYNSSVETDTQQKVAAERQYGQLAENKLLTLLPDANDEQKAIFRRKGEEISRKNLTEGEIAREMATEAKKFKDTLANVKKSIGPSRLFSGIKQSVLGTDRDFEKKKQDIRIKLKPLLEEGLYDTARNLLSELHYHPEERESIMTDLGEPTKKVLSKLPKFSEPKFKIESVFGPRGKENNNKPFFTDLSDDEKKSIKENMQQVIQSDPSVNLILLRKAYGDKNVDWQTFKDNLNDLIINGQFKMNDDQFNQLDLLDQPPLDNLDKLLYGMKLIGK